MKVAIYCRLSEEDKDKRHVTDDSESIQNQKSMLIQYATEQGWEIYGIYSDDDYTGADRSRPEFNRLLEDAKHKKFDIVLCKTQSRFTRELELVEKYIHGYFPIWGIRFVSIVDNADTENKGNKKSRQINGLVNEWYLEDMSENIKSVLTDKRKKGYHIGAFALYGYQKDPQQKGHLLIDEEAAEVVREVFTLFSQGYGKTAIAKILNEQGVPNPTEYKRQKGLRYQQPESQNSTLWRYYTISAMLRNEMYIGTMVQGKYGSVSYKTKQNRPRPKETWYRKENTHEAIIDQELWNTVQRMLEEKAKPFATGKTGIFAGKVKCADCGYHMRSTKTKDRYYLKCATHHIAKDACEGAFISVKALEDAVLSEIHRMSKEYLDIETLEKNLKLDTDIRRQQEQCEKKIETYQKKQQTYQKGISQAYLDRVSGILTEKEYLELTEEFRQGKQQSEKLMESEKKRLTELTEGLEKGDERGKRILKYINPEFLTKEIVEELIDHIVVGKKSKETGEIPVEIHWNF